MAEDPVLTESPAPTKVTLTDAEKLAIGRKAEEARAERKAWAAQRKREGAQKAAANRRAAAQKAAELREKVRNGYNPTPEEVQSLLKRGKTRQAKQANAQLTDLLAEQQMVRPRSVTELRLMVEANAKELGYDPVRELILMSKGLEWDPINNCLIPRARQIRPEDKIAIDKALLPFLTPPMAAAKRDEVDRDTEDGRTNVTVKTFRIAEETPAPAGPPPPLPTDNYSGYQVRKPGMVGQVHNPEGRNQHSPPETAPQPVDAKTSHTGPEQP